MPEHQAQNFFKQLMEGIVSIQRKVFLSCDNCVFFAVSYCTYLYERPLETLALRLLVSSIRQRYMKTEENHYMYEVQRACVCCLRSAVCSRDQEDKWYSSPPSDLLSQHPPTFPSPDSAIFIGSPYRMQPGAQCMLLHPLSRSSGSLVLLYKQ